MLENRDFCGSFMALRVKFSDTVVGDCTLTSAWFCFVRIQLQLTIA